MCRSADDPDLQVPWCVPVLRLTLDISHAPMRHLRELFAFQEMLRACCRRRSGTRASVLGTDPEGLLRRCRRCCVTSLPRWSVSSTPWLLRRPALRTGALTHVPPEP